MKTILTFIAVLFVGCCTGPKLGTLHEYPPPGFDDKPEPTIEKGKPAPTPLRLKEEANQDKK